MSWILENVTGIISIALSLIGLASAIAAVTPTPKDDNIVAKIKKYVNIIAFNFGYAKNAEDVSEENNDVNVTKG